MMGNDRAQLLAGLTTDLERAWLEKADPDLVDRLAAEYPALAEDLYDFFAMVVEATEIPSAERPELTESDDKARAWYEREGRSRLAAAYQELRQTAGQVTPGVTSSAGATPLRRVAEGGAIGFLGTLKTLIGENLDEIAVRLDVPRIFLYSVSVHPQVVPTGAREELARRAELTGKVSWSDALMLFETSQVQRRVAASRDGPYTASPPSYVDIVNESEMNDADRKFWLSFA
jgi:hypothetical protein